MKLLDTFKSELDKCGQISRVWFTSFTIDIEFIETFLLPAVLGADQPRTRMDYEALQLELNERGIDFRVFCDKRYIGTDQNKRTLIPVHGISLIKRDSETLNLGFSEDSLFHAKVIYIEGTNGNSKVRLLGAGSANLTLSGWGRNREVFQFVPANEKIIYKSMQDFFNVLFQNIGEECPLKNLRSFESDRSIARFCHSFQDEPFLDQFIGTRQHNNLIIWSPYFSKDLAGFILHLKKTFEQPHLSIHLVPDRVDGQYLRTRWSDGLQALLNDESLKLYQNPASSDDRITMTHAKLWKTSTHLAIGSWNCTRRGANTQWSEDGLWIGGANVEAGLIFEDRTSVESYLGKQMTVSSSQFASDECLISEALEVPELLPFDLTVEFDWATLTYIFTGIWNASEFNLDIYALKLPSLDTPIHLKWRPNTRKLDLKSILVQDSSKLLTEHRYEVLKNGERCGTGLLLELSAPCRRAQQCDDLKSLFDTIIAGTESIGGAASYRVSNDEGEGEEGLKGRDDEIREISPVSNEISYFRLFSASYQYAISLNGITTLRILEQWAFTRPGCLEELVEKTGTQIRENTPSLFFWMLAQEVNDLCRLALKLRKKLRKDEAKIPLQRWKNLKVKDPSLPAGINAQYLELIKAEYK